MQVVRCIDSGSFCLKTCDWLYLKPNKYKKILKACALEYKAGMMAPVMKAYGEGAMAEKLLAIAKKHNVDIKEDESEELLLVLKSMKVNQQIPAEIYSAIARIFSFFYLKSKQN